MCLKSRRKEVGRQARGDLVCSNLAGSAENPIAQASECCESMALKWLLIMFPWGCLIVDNRTTKRPDARLQVNCGRISTHLAWSQEAWEDWEWRDTCTDLQPPLRSPTRERIEYQVENYPLGVVLANKFRKASTASWVACPEASGTPPIRFSRVALEIVFASAMVLPSTSSVTSDPHAIAGTHPFARNRIASIRPRRNRAASSNTSPQAGFSTRTRASASARSPTFRGCSK